MHGSSNKLACAGILISALLLISAASGSAAPAEISGKSADALPTLTNLAQLTSSLTFQPRLLCNVRLEGVVCAATRPSLGVVVLQDATGVELLELGGRAEPFRIGERVRIESDRVLLRRRSRGTQISAAPVVDNDGLHPTRRVTGEIALKAGRVPIEIGWFNRLFGHELSAGLVLSNGVDQKISDRAFSHLVSESAPGETNLSPGLKVQVYHGTWEEVPDFDLLSPVRTGTATNIDLAFCTRNELVSLKFTGFFEVPQDGIYTFVLNSDDGSLLFIGDPQVPVQRLGPVDVSEPATAWIGQPMNAIEERRWLAVEGRVTAVLAKGHGLELELRSGANSLPVEIADAAGLDAAALRNAYVRVVGVGRAALSPGQRIVLSELSGASGRDCLRVLSGADATDLLPVTAISEVQKLPVEEAARGLQVRVRGVVTDASRSERRFSLQDDTRGIFVDHGLGSDSFPRSGESWVVVGHTAPGNFAPIIVAENAERLGPGKLPEPARPSWNELANGSQDAQRVEFRGVVSKVRANQLTFLLPEGSLEVRLENHIEADLRRYEHAIVRVRGTLFAVWNAGTREVQFGSILMRNAVVITDTPAPADPFVAPARNARDLLRFDVQSEAFSRVKVRGQVLYADAQDVFALDDGAGLRVQAAGPIALQAGDRFEAVGYPEISGPSPLLRHALVRQTGNASLPEPKVLVESEDLRQKGLDSTRVAVVGRLIGLHLEQGAPVLEMQANRQLFVARLRRGAAGQLSLRPGSRLELTGVCVQTISHDRTVNQVETFELLLNSAADIRVISQPSWWTLKRLAGVVGVLLLILLLAAAWITQLRRRVELRTAQLRKEIRQRELAERRHAIEAERSRIARDLHDDLGAGLSEINLLVGTRQRRSGEDGHDSPLFRTIAAKTRGLIAALDVIVWAVDPEDNSLQSLADYLNGFVAEFLSHSGVTCRLKVPMIFPPVMLDGQVRHGLLMAVKESLNNVVRHAHATEVEFRLATVENALEIVIADNGRGFETSSPSDRHGVKNLSARLAALGGNCRVESAPGQGTTVTLRFPLDPVTAAGLIAATP